jgi:hypothetical protein
LSKKVAGTERKKEISSKKDRTNVTEMSNTDNKKRLAQFDKGKEERKKTIIYVRLSRSI